MAPRRDPVGTAALWRWVLTARDTFLLAVAVAVGVSRLDSPALVGVPLVTLLVLAGYHVWLRASFRRRGRFPRAMAFGDQLLPAALTMVLPVLHTASLLAALFGLGLTSLIFPRRQALQAAVVGTMGFTAAYVVSLINATARPGQLVGLVGYTVMAFTTWFAVSYIAGVERETRTQLLAILEGLQLAVWEFDLTADQVTFVSPELERLTSIRTQHLIDGRVDVRSLMTAESFAVLRDACNDAARTGRVVQCQHGLDTPTGALEVRQIITARVDDAGRTLLRGSMQDVTEETARRYVLEEQTGQRLALLELARVTLDTTDPARLVDRAGEIIGGALGTDCTVVQEAEGAPAPADALVWQIQSGGSVLGSIVVSLTAPTNSVAAFLDGAANLLGSALARISAEQRLLQAQKVEALGQFAGGIAHDFNNLLTAQLGYAELLRPAVADQPTAQSNLEALMSVSQRAAAVVAQLLSFSRGRSAIAVEPVAVTTAVTELRDLLQRVVGEAVEVVLSLDRDAGHTRINRHQLEQALVNLAANARDAMPGGGRLHVTVRPIRIEDLADPHLPAGQYVQLTIADEGTGMDGHIAARALEPFFTTKPEGRGTGLGLATVEAFVRQAGGSLCLDSTPGRGTTVTLLLPASAPGQESKPAAPVVALELGGAGTAHETVLLVEDRAAVRTLLVQVLRTRGYTVLEASNGVEALTEVLREPERVDVVVTDVVMPQIDGPTLVAELLSDNPDLAVLYMSGYAEQQVTCRIDAERSAFLQKPFGVEEFLQKVRSVIMARAPSPEQP